MKPYSFGYAVKGHHGEQHHQESGIGGQAVKGSYGFKDARGIQRLVDYVADHSGFKAQVKTNEPGTVSKNPASVSFISSAHPYFGAGGHNGIGGGHSGIDGGHSGIDGGHGRIGATYGGGYSGIGGGHSEFGGGHAGMGARYGGISGGHARIGSGHGAGEGSSQGNGGYGYIGKFGGHHG